MRNVLLVTSIPSPYQVEFFNAISLKNEINLMVLYLNKRSESRLWSDRDLRHKHSFYKNLSNQEIHKLISWADLFILGNYQNIVSKKVISYSYNFKVPCVLWGERPGFNYPNIIGRLYRKFKFRYFRGSNFKIWGIGNFAVLGYKFEFGSKIEIINLPYYSDLIRFNSKSYDLQKINTNERVILYSGSLIKRKGVDLLAKAYLTCALKYSYLKLIIIGCGPLEGEMRETLSPVSSQVEFHGFVEWDSLPEYYAKAHILCAPSRYDGWGLIVPEALSSGLPVISTNKTGACLDLITPTKNGWIIEEDNLIELTSALEEFSNLSINKLLEMSRFAIDSVKNHSLDDGVGKFIKYSINSIESV